MPHVCSHPTPAAIQPGELTGSIAVVIDILRASTTITAALHAGAAHVLACLEVADALRLREELNPPVLLGGERHCVRIDGFDLGNSPAEYTPARVAGTTVIFTTTNGTRAALACRDAKRIVVGCFANLGAVEQLLSRAHLPVHLVCAGTNGREAPEDSLFAGALASRLHASGFTFGNAHASAAAEACAGVQRSPGVLAHLQHAPGGRQLTAAGLGDDIVRCAEVDSYPVVPEEFPAGRDLRGTGLCFVVSGAR